MHRSILYSGLWRTCRWQVRGPVFTVENPSAPHALQTHFPSWFGAAPDDFCQRQGTFLFCVLIRQNTRRLIRAAPASAKDSKVVSTPSHEPVSAQPALCRSGAVSHRAPPRVFCIVTLCNSAATDAARRGSHHPLDHHLLDLGDCLGRVQALGAGLGAVHDRVAAVQLERVFQIVQPLARRFVA